MVAQTDSCSSCMNTYLYLQDYPIDGFLVLHKEELPGENFILVVTVE